jgi:outer membrane immunogenic protein
MKKIYLITCLIMFPLSLINAQKAFYNPKEKIFDAGVGISGTGFPVYAGINFNLMKDITLGAEFSIRAYNDDWNGNNYTHTIIGFSSGGNYHFSDKLQLPKEFDVYGGLNAGFYIWLSPSGYHGSHSSGVGIGGQFGARYFFTKTFGLNFELVGGTVLYGCKVGISYKF